MSILKITALILFLAFWLACVFLARNLIRLLAVKIGLTSIPIFVYILGAFVLLIPLLPVSEWLFKKFEKLN